MAQPLPLSEILSAVEHLEPARALDLGCGSGALARALAQRGWSVTGLDHDAEKLRRARAGGGGVTYVEADMTVWEPPHPFELIVNRYAVPGGAGRTVLGSMRRSLAPGGTVVVVEWDRTMAERVPMLRAHDLVTLDEVRAAFEGCSILRQDTIVTPGEPDELDGVSVLFAATAPEG